MARFFMMRKAYCFAPSTGFASQSGDAIPSRLLQASAGTSRAADAQHAFQRVITVVGRRDAARRAETHLREGTRNRLQRFAPPLASAGKNLNSFRP